MFLSYNAVFPPQPASEERKEHCEALLKTMKKIAAKALILLNNSYMTDVMIIAELLLLTERSRESEKEMNVPDRPASYEIRAKQWSKTSGNVQKLQTFFSDCFGPLVH